MLKGMEVRVGPDLNHAAVAKEIRNDFAAGEVMTGTAICSFTDDGITVRSVGIAYNQHKLNLEILQQVYQLNQLVRGTHGNREDSEHR